MGMASPAGATHATSPAAVPHAGGADGTGPFISAPHPPLPIVPTRGGPILAHPRLVLVTYQSDAHRTTMVDHARWMVGSSWLSAVGAEYGTALGTVAHVLEMPNAPAAITDRGIQAQVPGMLRSAGFTETSSAALRDVLVMFYFPSTTKITKSAQVLCNGVGGYHDEVSLQGIKVPYAVIPACQSLFPRFSDIEGEEIAASHELVEAMTDPLPRSHPAYSIPLSDASLLEGSGEWVFAGGGEIGDLCVDLVSPLSAHRDGAWVAQRMYSNAAARAGDRDPCAAELSPSPTYFNLSVPPVVVVEAGTSTTVTISGWSTAPVDPWNVVANTDPDPSNFDSKPAVDPAMVGNGTKASLTLSVPAGTKSGDASVFMLFSGHDQSDIRAWPVLVLVP